jgi:putative ABC transport system permease protein
MNHIFFMIKIALLSLLRRKVRLGLTLSSIGVSVFAATFYYGFMQQSYWGLGESFARSGQGHILIAQNNWFEAAKQDDHRVPRDEMEELRQLILEQPTLARDISAISLKRHFTGLVGTSEGSQVFVAAGVSPEGYGQLMGWAPITEGEPINEYAPYGINIGKQLAEKLGVQVDDGVALMLSTDDGRINAIDATIQGISDSGSRARDEVALTIPLPAALEALASDQIDVMALSLYETEATQRVRSEVAILLKKTGSKLTVRSWDEVADYYQNVRALYNRIFGGILMVLTLVTSLAVGNTVLMSVYERSQEIGILRAIGGRGSYVTRIFLWEGLLLGLMGAALGLIGLFAFEVIGNLMGGIWMPPPPGSSKPYPLTLMLDSLGVLSILGLCLVVTISAAFVPAFLGSRRNIAQLLAHACAMLIFLSPSLSRDAQAQVLDLQAGEILKKIDQAFPGVGIDSLLIETKFIDQKPGGQASTVSYRVLRTPQNSLVVSQSDKPGQKLVILLNDKGMWMQKEGSRQAIRVSPAQRLLGQASHGDVNVRYSLDYEAQSVERQSQGIMLQLIPRRNREAAYSKIVLELDQTQTLRTAAYYALSGKLLKKALFSYQGYKIQAITLTDALYQERSTTIVFGGVKRMKSEAGMFSLQRMLMAAKLISEEQL